MFMEEQNHDRVNVKRTLQLLDTGAKTIATGCPFCMTMLTDGIKSKSLEDTSKQLDVAELLEQSCAPGSRRRWPRRTPGRRSLGGARGSPRGGRPRRRSDASDLEGR